jgi:hypothetical protein
MPHNWQHIAGQAGLFSGGGFVVAAIYAVTKLSKGAEIIATFLPFLHGKNGNAKLTKEQHDSICLRHLDPIFKDITLHTQRLEQGEKKFVELREDQRKDFEMLHNDIMAILERGQK